jgi:lysophospholipase L1-like esterase
MSAAQQETYLATTVEMLKKHHPENRAVHIVCHGHSVPAGYFATPLVDTFNAYPHLLHLGLKRRYPFAVINVIVTAIGNEDSGTGVERFADEVLCHRPDVVTIDYGLNDRRIGLDKARAAWSRMIEAGLAAGVRLILLTPTPDTTQTPSYRGADRLRLVEHAEQIRRLADEYEVGLVDSLEAFQAYMETGDISDLLSWSNHPNRRGHEIVARELLRWFPMS